MKLLMELAQSLARRLVRQPVPTLVPFGGADVTLCLRDAQGTTLHGAEGRVLRARSGVVWITQDGDVRDIVLQAGESFRLDRRGPAVISPLSDAAVELLGGEACAPTMPPQAAIKAGNRQLTAGAPRVAPLPA